MSNSGSETYDVLLRGAGLLRLSAEVLERTLTVKGEAGNPTVIELVRQQREAADAMLQRAREIQPSPMLRKWGRGQAEAMKYLHQITPGRPS